MAALRCCNMREARRARTAAAAAAAAGLRKGGAVEAAAVAPPVHAAAVAGGGLADPQVPPQELEAPVLLQRCRNGHLRVHVLHPGAR